jgi:sterol O-acyltransferase
VHEFLLRHVYLEAIDSFKWSKRDATFFTFFFSSVLHELVVSTVARKVSIMFFLLQMSQIPLIWVGRLPAFRRYWVLGNVFFWISLTTGMPLLALLYTRDVFLDPDRIHAQP